METLEFEGPVVRETAYGVVEDLGTCKSKMVLTTIKSTFKIEWTINEGLDSEEITEIGIWAEDKKVTEYDGVFELPKEAIQLLNQAGFDTKDVEVEDDGTL